MHAAEAILTARGGMTSHAALVARGWGKCCIVGCNEINISVNDKQLSVGDVIIKEGDWIEVSGFSGTVKKISVRSTHIQTFNKATAIIPNSDIISSSVVNWMHDEVDGRVSVPIEVAYDSDVELVKKILLEIANGHSKVMSEPEPVVLLRGFGESAIKFELRAFVNEKFSLFIQSDLNFEVLKKFSDQGIEIPFPKRDLNLTLNPVSYTHLTLPTKRIV